MDYIRDMKAVLDEMEAGKAATEPSNLGRPNLDTYFRHGNAIVTWNAAGAEKYAYQYPETFVFRDEDIVFRQIDEHTWEGNGHLVYNESVYVIEGEDKARPTSPSCSRSPTAMATMWAGPSPSRRPGYTRPIRP